MKERSDALPRQGPLERATNSFLDGGTLFILIWRIFKMSRQAKPLCEMAVSESKHLSSESRANWKFPNIASRPECRFILYYY